MENNPIVNEIRIVNKQQIFDLARKIQATKNDIKNIREMQENMLSSDSAFSEIEEQYKAAMRDRKQRKASVMASKDGLGLVSKMEDSRLELKELNESLSVALEVYVAKTGNVRIETNSGTEIMIAKKFSIKPSQLKLFE